MIAFSQHHHSELSPFTSHLQLLRQKPVGHFYSVHAASKLESERSKTLHRIPVSTDFSDRLLLFRHMHIPVSDADKYALDFIHKKSFLAYPMNKWPAYYCIVLHEKKQMNDCDLDPSHVRITSVVHRGLSVSEH